LEAVQRERKVRSRFLIGWSSAWLLAIDDDLSLLWEAYAYHRKAELYSFFFGKANYMRNIHGRVEEAIFIIPPAFFFSLPVL
jgi:hypothetical protein